MPELKYPTAEQLAQLFAAGPLPRLRDLHITQALLGGQSPRSIAASHPQLTESQVLFVVRGTLKQLARHLLPEELRQAMTHKRAQAFSREPYRTYWLPVLKQVIAQLEAQR